MEEVNNIPKDIKNNCKNCGAALKHKPNTTALVCDYCGYEAFIETAKTSFEELELDHYLKIVGEKAHTNELETIQCKTCGAKQHVEDIIHSFNCAYCAESLIIDDGQEETWILPEAVLPFQIDKQKARSIYIAWVKKMWFAPNKLKKASQDPNKFAGVFIPFWTFDSNLSADYTGYRGEYYYDEQSYRDSEGRKQTRRVRKTNWSYTEGRISGFINDILVNASRSRGMLVPKQIKQWDLKSLEPFSRDYLRGYITEKYSISLRNGHQTSYERAKQIANGWIRQDIGGDAQKISDVDYKLEDETFKLVLLPIYINSYFYMNKEYFFYLNGQTGEIHGKRPYSVWKIVIAVLIGLIIIGIIALIASQA